MKREIEALRLQACIAAQEKVSVRLSAVLADLVLRDFDEKLLPAVEMWLDGKLTDSFSADECTLQDIMEDTDATLFEALCMLNMQIRNPEKVNDFVWVLRGDAVDGVHSEE